MPGRQPVQPGLKTHLFVFQYQAKRLQNILHSEIDGLFVAAAVEQDHAELLAFTANSVFPHAVNHAADLIHAEIRREKLVVTNYGKKRRNHAAAEDRPVR